MLINQKLANKITGDGLLLVKSQTARTQLDNKANVVAKMNELVNFAILKKKIRIATHPSKAAKEKRIEGKKRNAAIKAGRRNIKYEI
jgi:ribosome-associated protein